jgi:hypothetical protein
LKGRRVGWLYDTTGEKNNNRKYRVISTDFTGKELLGAID